MNANQLLKRNYLLTAVLPLIFLLKYIEFTYQSASAILYRTVDAYILPLSQH